MSETTRRAKEVTTEQLDAYLRNEHWVQTGKLRSIATIWNREDDLDAEVVLPLSRAVKDYPQRIRDAIESIAAFEKRGVFEVINDIGLLFSNLVSVRVIHADTEDGTIPINDGVLLISRAKDLLFSAAMAVYAKRKHFTGKPPKDATEYLNTLLLGQTEVGSYVVNVISPLQKTRTVTSNEAETAEPMPLAKAVTLNLVTGLEALTQASAIYEKQHDPNIFESTILKGASANMCDALLGFSGSSGNRSFEIKVTPANGPMFESEPRVFKFDEHQIEVLKQASSYFKEDYVLPQRTLIGYVRKLSRPKEDASGTIILDTQINGINRNVQIALSSDDYHNAVQAHDKQSFVECSGDVHIKSRSAQLLNPYGFKVIGLNDLF